MANIQLFVGTVTGTALSVAQAVADALQAQGHQVYMEMAFAKELWQTEPPPLLLICTSNTGAGDLPQNIRPFFRYLVKDTPSLVGTRFGLINLGDSSYPTFGEAGQLLADLLMDLGASPISEILKIDAIYDDDPKTKALHWLTEWTRSL